MVQKAASSSTNIQAEIQGEISGQIVVGNNNVQIHAEHGALVNVISGDNVPVPRPRPTPVLSLRPRRFRGLLDRKTEIGTATSALTSEATVEIHGEAGSGKTSMLRHLAYQPEADRFSAGVVYLSARREQPADLLQFLFDAFYESDVPFKPTDTQVRHFLDDKQALVLLDDIELTREAFEALLDAVPSCSFVVASGERRLWGEVQSITVGGLPPEDALTLVERELGRPLTSEERDPALSLCAAVEFNPLRILQEVAAVRDERRSLTTVRFAKAAPASEEVTGPPLASLSESQRSILGVLAAFGGTSVHGDHLAALSGLPDSEPVTQTLQQRNLVQAEESRRQLTGNLAAILNQTWDLTPWRESALEYFVRWAEEHRQMPDRLLEEAECVRELLEWGGAKGHWREVQRLGRAMEGAFTLSGRWDAWKFVVQSVLQASRALGDQAGAGWAFHQLGTRALCLTDESDARSYLSQATDIRESLGDRFGAAVSRHNLEILLGPPAPADNRGSSQSGSGTSVQVPLLLKIAGSALLVGLGGLGLWKLVGDGSIPSPTGLSAVVASHTEVGLSWMDKSDNETGFRIERRKGDGSFSEVARAPANFTSFKDSALEPNTGYTYRLRAAYSDGDSGYSNEIPVLTLPAAPSALLLRDASAARIELVWTDNSPNPSGFKIERSIDGGREFNILATVVGATTYSDTSIPDEPNLYYRVRATNSSGDSGYSNVEVWSVIPKPPAAPRLIDARAASGTQVNLRWTDGSDNETEFIIERKSGGGSYRQIASVEANATNYEDRGLTSDTSYVYRMRATNDEGDSAYTNEVAATTPLESPNPPSDLAARPDSGVVDLAWRDNSDNETGFHIERKTIGDSYQRIKTIGAGAVAIADSGLNPQTNYTYRVQSFNRAGGSAFSNEVTITTPALPGKIAVRPTEVKFGQVSVGSTSSEFVNIYNTGKGTLDINVSGASGPFKLLSPREGFTLGPGREPLQVKVEFAPADSVESTGTLTIKSSDPGRPEVLVKLIGTGKREPVRVTLLSLTLAAQEIIGGESAKGTVTLSGIAPAGGTAVFLSSDSRFVRIPIAVMVPGGKTSATFDITSVRVRSDTKATISALLDLTQPTAAVLLVKAERKTPQPQVVLDSLTLNPVRVKRGQRAVGTVKLSGNAPRDIEVAISSSNTSLATVPKSVTVKSGRAVANFVVATVTRSGPVTVGGATGRRAPQSDQVEVTITAESDGKSLKKTLTVW